MEHTSHLDIGCNSNPRNPYNADKLYGVDIIDLDTKELIALGNVIMFNCKDMFSCIKPASLPQSPDFKNSPRKILNDISGSPGGLSSSPSFK